MGTSRSSELSAAKLLPAIWLRTRTMLNMQFTIFSCSFNAFSPPVSTYCNNSNKNEHIASKLQSNKTTAQQIEVEFHFQPFYLIVSKDQSYQIIIYVIISK